MDVIPIERVRQEATLAAQTYDDVNAACPYPFFSPAGKLFLLVFMDAKAAMSEDKKH